MSIPEAVTMTFMRPFLHKGHNLTTDIWFASSALADNLMEKVHISLNGCDIPLTHSKFINTREKNHLCIITLKVKLCKHGKKPVLPLATVPPAE